MSSKTTRVRLLCSGSRVIVLRSAYEDQYGYHNLRWSCLLLQIQLLMTRSRRWKRRFLRINQPVPVPPDTGARLPEPPFPPKIPGPPPGSPAVVGARSPAVAGETVSSKLPVKVCHSSFRQTRPPHFLLRILRRFHRVHRLVNA